MRQNADVTYGSVLDNHNNSDGRLVGTLPHSGQGFPEGIPSSEYPQRRHCPGLRRSFLTMAAPPLPHAKKRLPYTAELIAKPDQMGMIGRRRSGGLPYSPHGVSPRPRQIVPEKRPGMEDGTARDSS